jgi:WD40 repeat protein
LNDESVAIWKAASNELTQQLKSPVRPNANPSDPSSPCIQFAWSPGGLHVVAIHADGRVHLWDAAGDRPVHELRTIPGQRIAWSPDGSELALLHPEGKLQIWNVAAQAVAQEVATKDTFGVAWSCTGDLLATAGISTSGDCLLHTWLAKRLVQKRTLHGIAHAMEIQLAFSGDGQSVFCRDGGWGLIRWEVDGDKAPVDTSGLGFDLDTMSQVVFCSSPALLRYWRTDMKTPLYSVLSTRQGQLIVSPEGRASGPPEAVNELVYVAETEDGQETLTAEEFAKRFGWSQR